MLHDGVAEYVRIPQQPTALEACSDLRLAAFDGALGSCGFAVQRGGTPDITPRLRVQGDVSEDGATPPAGTP